MEQQLSLKVGINLIMHYLVSWPLMKWKFRTVMHSSVNWLLFKRCLLLLLFAFMLIVEFKLEYALVMHLGTQLDRGFFHFLFQYFCHIWWFVKVLAIVVHLHCAPLKKIIKYGKFFEKKSSLKLHSSCTQVALKLHSTKRLRSWNYQKPGTLVSG